MVSFQEFIEYEDYKKVSESRRGGTIKDKISLAKSAPLGWLHLISVYYCIIAVYYDIENSSELSFN